MDAHLIMLDDIMLGSGITKSRLLAFPVTPGAEFGDIARKYWGIGIGPGLYAVCAMAIGTDWRIRIVLRGHHAMGAFVVKLNNLGMADGAVDLA